MSAPALPVLTRPHLLDSTVWSKATTSSHPDMADWLNRAVRSDLVVMCDVVRIELLRSARNSDAFNRQSEMLGLLPSVPMGEHSFTRALEVQSNLARRGKHRGVPPVDLLIAAAAEAAAIPLLHYDHDFDLISEVTGQPSQWVAPAGSLP